MKKLLLILLFVSGLSSAQQYQDIGDTRLKHENGVFSIGPKPNKSAVPQLFKYPTTFQELVTMTNFEVDTATADVFVGSGALLTSIPQSAVTSLVTDLSGKQSTLTKDGSGGYVGLTLFKINFRNAANTFTSFLTNANTAARTYTFQDRDGTILDGTNLVTGSTDNAILRADGTGGVTTQSSGITIDDNNSLYLRDTIQNATYGTIYKGTSRFLHTYSGDSSTGGNTFLGLNSGSFNINNPNGTGSLFYGSYNTGVGYEALKILTSGYYNAAFGYRAGSTITTGASNFALGSFSMTSVSTGNNNVSVGAETMVYGNGTGNVWVGAKGGYGVASNNNSYNTAMGLRTAYTITTGSYNTLFGSNSGEGLTTGSNNIFIGRYGNTSGVKLWGRTTTGSYNILIGDTVKASDSLVSNQLNIGRTLYGNVNNATTKNIGVNVTDATSINSTFQINGSFAPDYISKTANYTATVDDYTIDCYTNSFTVTLPAAATITGRVYFIRNGTSGTTITVDANASETIDGATTHSLATQYSRVTIQSNGTNWIILSE